MIAELRLLIGWVKGTLLSFISDSIKIDYAFSNMSSEHIKLKEIDILIYSCTYIFINSYLFV